MPFPYDRYETLAEPLTCYYPSGEEQQARRIFRAITDASRVLAKLLKQEQPEFELLLVAPADWDAAPREEDAGAQRAFLPYWTGATEPPCIVIPTQLDPIVSEPSPEKFHFLLYHQLTYAFLDSDPRPWPEEYPLWADEWQLQFAALWLSQQLDGQQDIVTRDLHEEYAEIFVTEEDGKTPVTVRGFDWDEDTSPEDYLCFDLLLERFAADLLARYEPEILPRFLDSYRETRPTLLSDDVTAMLGKALGPDGVDWLEGLPYF